MKFGQYLRTHAIDEWKRAYIDYRQLKKQIGRAEQELLAMDAGDAEDSSAGVEEESGPEASLAAIEADRKRAAAARGARAAAQGAAAGPNLHEVGVVRSRNRDVERGLDALDDDDDDEQDTTVKPAESPAEGPERGFSSRSSHYASPALSPTFSQGRSELSPEHDSDDTQGTGQALIRESPADAGAKNDSPPVTRKRSFSRPKPPTRDFSSPAKRKWRTGFSPGMSLRELQEAMPKQSRRFVKMLDRELERVSGFYADREGEAVERYEQLSAQWRELVSTCRGCFLSALAIAILTSCCPADHKKEFQAFRQRELQPPQIVSSILPKHAHLPNVPGVGLVRRTLAQRKVQARNGYEHNDEGRGHDSAAGHKSRRFSSESQYSNGHADGPAPKADRDSDADDEAHDAQPVYRHGRPEDYTNARSRLKLASALLTFAKTSYSDKSADPCFIRSFRVLPLPRHAQIVPSVEPDGVHQGELRTRCPLTGRELIERTPVGPEKIRQTHLDPSRCALRGESRQGRLCHVDETRRPDQGD